VHVGRGRLWEFIEEEELMDGLTDVVFESDTLTVQQLDALQSQFEDVNWVGVAGLLSRDVGTKDAVEVERIRAAQRVTESVFDHVLRSIEPGMTEQDVAADIVYQHLMLGAEKMSFDPIVASGPNGALPHARPTDRTLQEGELIVIDMGCFLNGYASDMTRTVALGEPGEAARLGYDVVKRAQEAALQAARAGMPGKELDAVARDVIDEAGLGDYFSHGLGHGVGLQIHEWPRVSYTVEEELPAGACVTIEPGVYVSEDGYGVRIEDIIVLREEGCENLTSAEKDLIVL